MRLQQWLAWVALLSGWAVCAAYKVLVVFPLPSRSHGILGKAMARTLLDAGHVVTFITPYPEKNPPKNLKQIDVSFLSEVIEIAQAGTNMFDTKLTGSFSKVKEIAYNLSTGLLQDQTVQSLLRDESFDAVVTEWFFSEMHVGFSQVFQCPWLLLSPIGMNPTMAYMVDDIQSPAVDPFFILGFKVPMTLKERLINTAAVYGSVLMTVFLDRPKDAIAYEKYFGPAAQARGVQLTEYNEAVQNVSILLLNSHPSLGQAISLPPNAVEIGGYHIDPNTPALPKDLQDILDNAPHGVVYFSMGSNLKSSDLPVEKRNALLKSFGSLKQTILWKFEIELPDTPKNVHIRSWFPQPSILAHKNVKIFITHGGMGSTTEAIYFGVPLIGIPVFGDQPVNMNRAVRNGYAIRVDLHSPDLAKDLEDAIEDMVINPQYTDSVKRLSQLFHDRPIHPASLLTYYIEHAVRTSGATHLRTATSSVPLYQRYLLDIIAIVLFILFLIILVLRSLLRCIFFRSKHLEPSKEPKSNKKSKRE